MSRITARDVGAMPRPQRERVLDWVREHRLDPSNVRSVHTFDPTGLAHAEVYVTDEWGRHQIDPTDSDRAWVSTRWFWLRTPFPDLSTIGSGA